jgi:ATP-dependent DNA ligase
VQLVARFDDGRASFEVCVEPGLVGKRLHDPYRPGERGWVKTKNSNTAQFAEERAAVMRGSR